ncbi:MAG: glycosyltransferase family 4 protein [Leptospiraceae bacterium]|nr:glycosyltransferase family 4 protein [Leptospiraceae bacterium]
MKLCIIVDDYLPDSTKIAAKMMHELAIEYKSQGHEVYVVTPDSYKKYQNLENQIEVLDGITIFRFPSGRLKNISKPIRLINECLLPFRALFHGRNIFKTWKSDLIIYYSPSIFWGYLVHKLKQKWKARSYLILRDFFPQWAIDNGILQYNNPLTKFFLFIERLNYNSADTIGLMSEGNLAWFQNYYKGKAHLEVLYNWVSDQPIVIKDFPVRKRLGIEDKIVFFYGGNIGHAQDMSQIIRLAKNLLRKKNAFFVLVGSGDEVELVRNSIQSESLTNMVLLDPVSQTEFKNTMSEFDIGLFCLNRNHKTHNFPGKILGYLVQSMPVLGSVNPGNDLKEVIESAKSGFVVESGDDQVFLNAAIQLLDSEVRDNCAMNCRKLLNQKFSVKNASKTILKIVN